MVLRALDKNLFIFINTTAADDDADSAHLRAQPESFAAQGRCYVSRAANPVFYMHVYVVFRYLLIRGSDKRAHNDIRRSFMILSLKN